MHVSDLSAAENLLESETKQLKGFPVHVICYPQSHICCLSIILLLVLYTRCNSMRLHLDVVVDKEMNVLAEFMFVQIESVCHQF